MANKNLFKSIFGKLIPETDGINHEQAPAYVFSPKHALAQLAATGTFNQTFYSTGQDLLSEMLGLCEKVDPEFIAKTAIYSREKGAMKDMPAFLCSVLSVKEPALLPQVFDRVIDNGKMLRNFVQIMRSGAVGRKSLGSLPKGLVKDWIGRKSDKALFYASVGNDPSLADIVKMVHPAPCSKEREALFGYLIGRDVSFEALPEVVQQYEGYKAGRTKEVPDVPFQMLTSLALGKAEWIQIAKNAGWQMTRMNLNTFARHGVFEDKEATKIIARRIASKGAIKKARVFPYQLLVAYTMAGDDVPHVVREALQDAMEIACANVPRLNGKTYVFPDVSGSMTWAAVTGHRKGSTSAVRCIDVAALLASAIVRKNPSAEVIAFEQAVVDLRINGRDSIVTNAEKLAKIGGGGTNCSAPLYLLNKKKAKGDLVVYVSDNQSWVDAKAGRGTETLAQWNLFKKRNPNAKMVCIDIQPFGDTQAKESEDIMNIGGFSDNVFKTIADFAAGRLSSDHWVGEIEAIEI